MDSIDKIAQLQLDRAAAVEALNKLDDALRELKDRRLNAQNLAHQDRLDREHRLLVRKRSAQQTAITWINSNIRALNIQVQRDRDVAAERRRGEVA